MNPMHSATAGALVAMLAMSIMLRRNSWSANNARRPLRRSLVSDSTTARDSEASRDRGGDHGELVEPTAPDHVDLDRRSGRRVVPGLAAVGRLVGRSLHLPANPRRDRLLGHVIVVAVVCALIAPGLAIVGLIAVVVLALCRSRSARRAHTRLVVAEMPDVIDLTRIALDAGLTVRLALESLVTHGSGSVVGAVAAALAHADQGVRLADSLESLRELGDPARPFAEALIASERYGAPARAGLDRAAHEARLVRRRRSEEAARRVPVKMLFPLVLCTLPALGVLTVVPLLARVVPSLTP